MSPHSSSPSHSSLLHHQQHSADNFLLHHNPHAESPLGNQMCNPPVGISHHNRAAINSYLGFDWSTSLLSAAASAAAAAVAASTTSPMHMSLPTAPVTSPSRIIPGSFPLTSPPNCFFGQPVMSTDHHNNMHQYHQQSPPNMDHDPLISVGSTFLSMNSPEKDYSQHTCSNGNGDDSAALPLPIQSSRNNDL